MSGNAARALYTRPPPALPGFCGIRRFWDAQAQSFTAQVLPGDFYVTRHDEVITTVLGSCVSACVRDQQTGLGGINHFMLPVDPDRASKGTSARYGEFALERLLNELVKHGARRERLEVKIFGGGNVLAGATDIGAANIRFVRAFFTTERLPIVAEDVGEACARRLRYRPLNGQVMINRLPMKEAAVVGTCERELQKSLAERPAPPPPELF